MNNENNRLPSPIPGSARLVGRFSADGWILAPLSAVFVLLVCLAWGRVGDAGADAFHELTTVMRMEAGQRLYSDIQYLHGPVAPYLLLLVRSGFGKSAGMLLGLCALLAWTEWILAWKLCRKTCGPAAAVLFTAMMWVQFTFAPGQFGRLFPYSLGALIGSVSLLAVLALIWKRDPAPWSPAAAGLLTAVALLSKFEIGLAASAVLFFWCVGMRRRTDQSIGWTGLLASLLVPAALFGLAVLVFPGFLEMTSPAAVLSSPQGRDYLIYAGSVLDARSLVHFLLTLATSSALFIGLLAAAASVVAGDWRGALLAGLCGTGGAVVLQILFPIDLAIPVEGRLDAHLSWAFLIPPLVYGIWRSIRDGNRWSDAAVAGGVLLLLVRTPNTLQPYLYGSFYLLPAMVIAIPFVSDAVKALGRSHAVAMTGLVCAGYFAVSVPVIPRDVAMFRAKAHPVDSSAAPLLTTTTKAGVLGPAVRFLKERLKPGDRIAVVPNEPVFYYATSALPVWPDHNYIGHLVRGDDETKLADLAMSRARFVVFSNRAYVEFGSARAGYGFADELKQRLVTGAVPVAEFTSDPNYQGTPDAPAGYVEPYYRIRIWEIPVNGSGAR